MIRSDLCSAMYDNNVTYAEWELQFMISNPKPTHHWIKNQYLKNPAFQSPKNPVTLYPSFLNSKKTKQEKASILNTQDNVGQAVAN